MAGWREVSGYHEIKQDCEPAFLHSVSNFLYHTSLPHIFWDISDVPVMGGQGRQESTVHCDWYICSKWPETLTDGDVTSVRTWKL